MMPEVALGVYAAFSVAALGWRAWLQYRRTGDHGLRGLSGRWGSLEWFGGVFVGVGMILLAAGPTAELAGLVEPWPALDRSAFHAAGLATALLGFAVTIAAQLQMRDSWRVGVDEHETTPLVTEGLFTVVRNPIYGGMLLVGAGIIGMAPNVVSAVAFGCSLLGIEIQVRRVEEPHLTRAHGERYLSYARRVGRFLPWVGRVRSVSA
jgi:protein-S-isoprenylcysteine O-methyltransferase Ste14